MRDEAGAPSSATPARVELLRAIGTTEAILRLQAGEFSRRGLTVPVSPHTLGAEAIKLVGPHSAPGDQTKLLQLLLAEILERQRAIDTASAATLETVAREAFVATTHRIRTRLDLILSCSEEIEDIAQASDNPGDLRELAQEIGLASRWVLQLCDKMHDLAHLSAGGAGEPVSFDANALIASVVEQLTPLARHSDLKLSAPNNEPLSMRGDRFRIERCVHYMTLIALSARGVNEVSLFASQRPGGLAAFVVNDDGSGDTLSERARVQAPGSLPEGGRTADAAGYAIARRLARALGGAIELEIIPGNGTSATLTVPVG